MAGPDDTTGLSASGSATAVADRPTAPAPSASDGFSVRSMSPGLVGAAIRGGIEKQRDLTAKEEQGRVEMNGIKVPEVPKMPEMPKESMTDFATMFGSAAMGIASIGSLMTRRPMIHALEASTGVMQAFHAGDLERSKQAFEQWKIATENATRMHQFEMDNFHAIMEKAKGNQEILRSELTGLAAATKNDAALALLNAGDTAGAVHLFTGIDVLGKRMTEGQLRVQDEIEKRHDLKTAEAIQDPAARATEMERVRQKWLARAKVEDPLRAEKDASDREFRSDRERRLTDAQFAQQKRFETAEERRAYEFGVKGERSDYQFQTKEERAAYEFGVKDSRAAERLADAKDNPARKLLQEKYDLFQERKKAVEIGDADEVARIDKDIAALSVKKAVAERARDATVIRPDGRETREVVKPAPDGKGYVDMEGKPVTVKQFAAERTATSAAQVENERTIRARDNLEKDLGRALTNSPEDQALLADKKQRIREEDIAGMARARTAATQKVQREGAVLTPDTERFLAEQYLRTGVIPPLGMGAAANAMRAQVLDRAADIAKVDGHNVADYIEGRATLKADAASLTQATKMYDSVHSYEATALDNLKVVEDAMTKGAGTAAGPVINRWYLAGKKATGDKDVAALDTALGAFRGEFAKIMSGSTGSVAAASDSARAEADKMIDGGQSPEALKAQIAVARKDMENRKVNLRKQVEDIQKRLRGGSIAASEGGDTPEISEAQYNALPAGAHYRMPGDPPGKVRVKP